MACTETGLKIRIRSAELTLNPLQQRKNICDILSWGLYKTPESAFFRVYYFGIMYCEQIYVKTHFQWSECFPFEHMQKAKLP